MATKLKTRKKAHKPKNHSNNLRTTGVFKRQDDVQIALGRLEAMTPEQRQVLMQALEHKYGSVYFRINITEGSFEKVGDDIDLYMLMRIYWDIKIHVCTLPLREYKDGMKMDEVDHFYLDYQHRSPSSLGSIREIIPIMISNFLDKETKMIYACAEFFPVLPPGDVLVNNVEPFDTGEITEIVYEYDPLIPDNSEFKYRPKTFDPRSKWSEKKLEENRNAILRKLLPN